MGKYMSRITYSALATAVAGTLAGAVARAQPTITNLGIIPGTIESHATGLSADGTVVVGYCVVDYDVTGYSKAFRWTSAGGMQDLGGLPGGAVSAYGYDVSTDGSVLVGTAGGLSIQPRAWRWTSAGGMVSLGIMQGGAYSWANGVSANGLVVVGYGDRQGSSGFNRAFRWTSAGGMQHLGTLSGGNISRAYAASSDGSVVTGFSDGSGTGGFRAYRWTSAGGMQNLGTLPGGWSSEGWAISADGSVIAGVSSGTGFSQHAMRWAGGVMQHLGALPGGFYSSAATISPDGSVVLGNSTGTGFPNYHAIMWTSELNMVDLNTYLPTLGVDLTGWELENATGINADGTALTGTGLFDGQKRAWLVTIPANPCSVEVNAGDANCDGQVNALDVGPFVLALTQGQSAWEATHSCGYLCAIDLNHDNNVNSLDVDPLVECLMNGCP
jgi:probable HAF family extracellular repeat protein